MRNMEHREFTENTRESQVSKHNSTELFENLDNNKDTISTFREDVKTMIAVLHIPNPKFVAQLKKYLKDKERDHRDIITINDYVKRADIIDFQETLDNWDKIEDYELKEQMVELSKSCSVILDYIEENQSEENIQTKKAKKHQDHEIEKYRDEPDEEEDKLYKKYGYRDVA